MSRKRKLAGEDDDDALGTSIELVELRDAVRKHCQALRTVADLLIAGKTAGAAARLDGAVTVLEDVVYKHYRNHKIRLRAEQKRKRKP
jgi:hypothetical protein